MKAIEQMEKDPYKLLEDLVSAWDCGFPPSERFKSEWYVSTMYLLCDLSRIVIRAREVVNDHKPLPE